MEFTKGVNESKFGVKIKSVVFCEERGKFVMSVEKLGFEDCVVNFGVYYGILIWKVGEMASKVANLFFPRDREIDVT